MDSLNIGDNLSNKDDPKKSKTVTYYMMKKIAFNIYYLLKFSKQDYEIQEKYL